MNYQRQIYHKLEAELSTKEVVVITGMRRVGKTTALKHLFDMVETANRAVFDLENPMHRKVFEEKNYDNVWNNLKNFGLTPESKSYIFVDEVQNLPEISRVVKYFYDHYNVKFILTGSSSYYLRNLFPESLAGRKIIFEMFPLTFSEFLVFKQKMRVEKESFEEKRGNKNAVAYGGLSAFYNEYVEFGGFPSVVLEQDRQRKKTLLEEIFTSYFEKDAKNLADFKDMSKLRDLILLLVPRIGSRLDINKLAKELQVSRETVYGYIAFLERTYFVALIPQLFGSIDRQAAGSKKMFLCDSGIARVLGQISEGQAFEQSVFQNLRGKYKLNYYSKNGGEVDFILDGKTGLEVKKSATRQDVANMLKRLNAIKVNVGYVVSGEFSEEEKVILAIDI